MGRTRIQNKRFCYACGNDKTSDNGLGYEHWYTNKPTKLYLCKNCMNRYVYNPEHNPINRRKTIDFKHRDIVLDIIPRTGICKICESKGTTNIHHREYHEDDPLKDTIELCDSCHMKEHWRLGSFKNNDRPRDPINGRFLKS